MVSDRKIAHALALTEISGIASGRVRKLVSESGDIGAIYSADDDALLDFHFINEDNIEDIRSSNENVSDWENRLKSYQNEGIELIFYLEDDYPDRLNEIGGPLLLYCEGNTSLLKQTGVGFTGSRSASDEAIKWTRSVAKQLGQSEVIISGGAEGVDAAAHKGALDAGGQTIVVYGTGLNVPYPEVHEPLFNKVLEENGLLISQRPPDAQPSRSGFLNRNETLSGLSRAVVVAATDGSGGTMTTYEAAKSQNRNIYCPDPELKLKPIGGIRDIIDDDGIPIRDGTEVVHRESDEDTADDMSSQSALHEFSG